MPKRSRKLTHDQTIFAYCLVGGVPAVALSLVWVWGGGHSPELRGTVTLLVLGAWLGFAAAARNGRLIHREKRFGDVGRGEVRRLSVAEALAMLDE